MTNTQSVDVVRANGVLIHEAAEAYVIAFAFSVVPHGPRSEMDAELPLVRATLAGDAVGRPEDADVS
jgi:hypothetical protein